MKSSPLCFFLSAEAIADDHDTAFTINVRGPLLAVHKPYPISD